MKIAIEISGVSQYQRESGSRRTAGSPTGVAPRLVWEEGKVFMKPADSGLRLWTNRSGRGMRESAI
ncbi:hypothetical protein [Derxia lacustris]|uniref:hypothetical protein n=1 Tax=Derxia lacustris TaxID=764842 RepID=UPI0015938CE6|nr:hypothetical protein [Derxia lacustris]